MSEFHVVPGVVADDILAAAQGRVVDIVAETYLLHDAGHSINPDSYFLRFPDKPDSRIIALPAYLGGSVDTAGIKWISSFPGNHDRGIPRASAVLILNDYATGRPYACLESAGISAARTAASAAIAAAVLGGTWPPDGTAPAPRSVGFVGTGVIASTIGRYLRQVGVPLDDVVCHDLEPARAARLAAEFDGAGTGSLADALDRDLVVFATTAGTPYVPADTPLRPGQLVLNVSLRDLAPELLLRANNVVDDVDHCLKAQTSPHLAEQLTGTREFVNGTLGQVLRGDVTLDPGLPTIFSPFGLGVLDIAVGSVVLAEALAAGRAVTVPGFFPG
ncbi:2,3-diaminopropionate biosynthesis protein SbnB [Longispora fulva]|uniref:2,3-diaminopropionate biosynthesis protein SbnB n=1 Tax=Longispora fulva TaxID=619741 RepID=A0A8J7GGF8_9ACTN|nr:2,3-diaminopropionate biosynthesis protein SbnB [Longispora fulva]MBG6136715.1 2,3-diaminopropionate biosynthesis protein SbnB [Longispora fulva]GIG59885.1 2,3-diaminopropionate biosynthesis protein SbnB [Longispora fulva]